MNSTTVDRSWAVADADWVTLAPGVQIRKTAWTRSAQSILTPDAISIIAKIHRRLNDERKVLLAQREERQRTYDRGAVPTYLSDEEAGRARGDWKVAPLPDDLLCRRVEITGPVGNTKMVINMLSRTADGFRADAAMLDFEDSQKPVWEHVVNGVCNVIGAADGTLNFQQPGSNGAPAKEYRLDPTDMPLLMVRVRGLHLDEVNLSIDGEPVAGGLLELVLCAFHAARILIRKRKTPKWYIPKCEHYREARWWNELFVLTQEELGIPRGTFKATFLIETLPAAYQMEEILFEFREHAAGLNGGRWDKIFSDIKVLREHPDRVLADRASISMNRPWMQSYVLELIRVCHRHGAFGMGGMAAFTPGRTKDLREEQTNKVLADKRFEASIGHDGCWVSHPYFIGPALSAFPRKNQLDVIPTTKQRPDLLPRNEGSQTIEGLCTNVRVGIAYVRGWNDGIGCVAWDNLMEDLATLEISRAQVWQWIRHGATLADGREVTRELVDQLIDMELSRIKCEVRVSMKGELSECIDRELARFDDAAEDVRAIFLEERFRPFLSPQSDPAGASMEERRASLRDGSVSGTTAVPVAANGHGIE